MIIQEHALSHPSQQAQPVLVSLRRMLLAQHSRSPRLYLSEREACDIEDISCRYAAPMYAYARANGCDPLVAERVVADLLFSLQPPFSAAGGLHRMVLQRLSSLHPDTEPSSNRAHHADLLCAQLPQLHQLEQQHAQLRSAAVSPLQAFRRSFGFGLIAQALKHLHTEARQAGHEELFIALQVFLTSDPAPRWLHRSSRHFHLPPATLFAAIVRLRLRLRELVDDLLLQTVADSEDLARERNQLRRLLRESYLST